MFDSFHIVFCFWLMKPGARAASRITVSSCQTPILPTRPSSQVQLFCMKFSIFPLTLCLLCPTIGLTLGDKRHEPKLKQKWSCVFSCFWKFTGGRGGSFRHKVRLDWGPYAVSAGLSFPLLSPCGSTSCLCLSASLSALLESHVPLCTNSVYRDRTL